MMNVIGKISLRFCSLTIAFLIGTSVLSCSLSTALGQTGQGSKTMKLASTRIVTKHVPELAAFYEKITQIVPVGTDTYVEVRTPGSVLAIADEQGVKRYNAGAAIGAENRTMILEFEVADVDAERARLKSIVHTWVSEPTDQPWGYRSMLFRDPDGNLINFYTPLHKRS